MDESAKLAVEIAIFLNENAAQRETPAQRLLLRAMHQLQRESTRNAFGNPF
jgi:hypothetical protein